MSQLARFVTLASWRKFWEDRRNEHKPYTADHQIPADGATSRSPEPEFDGADPNIWRKLIAALIIALLFVIVLLVGDFQSNPLRRFTWSHPRCNRRVGIVKAQNRIAKKVPPRMVNKTRMDPNKNTTGVTTDRTPFVFGDRPKKANNVPTSHEERTINVIDEGTKKEEGLSLVNFPQLPTTAVAVVLLFLFLLYHKTN